MSTELFVVITQYTKIFKTIKLDSTSIRFDKQHFIQLMAEAGIWVNLSVSMGVFTRP